MHDRRTLQAVASAMQSTILAVSADNVARQPDDVALVENRISMHARQPFRGTRKMWASLVAAEQHTPTSRLIVPQDATQQLLKVHPAGFEPATSCMSSMHSNQLSYGC